MANFTRKYYKIKSALLSGSLYNKFNMQIFQIDYPSASMHHNTHKKQYSA